MLDLSLDLTTAAGRMMARTVVNFAEYERKLISERTKAGLAAKKARGESIGRPRLAKPGVVRRIVMYRSRPELREDRNRPGDRRHPLPGGPAQLAEQHRSAGVPERHGRSRNGGNRMMLENPAAGRADGNSRRGVPAVATCRRGLVTTAL
ncbi:recombinase family protein [Mycolicibacterium hodleri]|uniref:recombinase family protein n=1 Tax=Mycolicibacterium hodleri TaxID=49897 RepID=UPI0031832E6B